MRVTSVTVGQRHLTCKSTRCRLQKCNKLEWELTTLISSNKSLVNWVRRESRERKRKRDLLFLIFSLQRYKIPLIPSPNRLVPWYITGSSMLLCVSCSATLSKSFSLQTSEVADWGKHCFLPKWKR